MLDFSTHINRALAIIGILFGAVLVLSAAVAVAPTFFTSVADTNDLLGNESVTTGDETSDSLKPIFRLVFGIVALVGFIGILIAAVTIRGSDVN